jgi:transposase
MPKKYRVQLSEAEQAELKQLISKRSSKSEQVKRAYALLAADENGEQGWTDAQIQQTYGLSIPSIERLRERLVSEGLKLALTGKKREIFVEKRFSGEVEAKLIALRCSPCPAGYQRWTLQLLADEMVRLQYVDGISDESVRQLLKKMKLNLGKSKVG